MTKEEIVQKALSQIRVTDGHGEIGEYISNAMDEYAKQQSVDFFKWYGTRMASLIKYICEVRPIAEDKKMEEIILKHEGATLDQLYSQFIEQQNKP